MLESIYTIGFMLAAGARPCLGRSHMEAYQLSRLKSLVRYASCKVPYYRELLQARGIEPGAIRNLGEFRKIPVTGKQQLPALRLRLPALDAADAELIEHKTSGSTGVPVRILRSPAEERRLNMLRWRMHLMMGLRPGERIARVKTTWEPLPRRFERLQLVVQRTGLMQQRVFDCLLPAAQIYQELIDYQPHFLGGYPGSIVKVALQHSRQGGVLRNLRRVFCGGEYLSPHQRRIMEECFGVPVCDTYGTTECNLMAWQCPQTGLYHVCDDGVFLEICRDGVPVAEGEEGEVIITALHCRTFPIIRYALGDRAVKGPSPCPCGSPFSTIGELRGRITDFLTLPDGRQLHPFELLNEIVLAGADWIAEYEFIQEAVNRLRLRIVRRRPVSNEEEARLHSTLMQKLGTEAQLEIEWVKNIAAGESGKFHFCRSLVAANRE